MTSFSSHEGIVARVRRILVETSLLGLIVRAAARVLLSLSRLFDQAGCRLITGVQSSLLTTANDKHRFQRNVELANRHYGQRCFILGNGPTLCDENLELLRKQSLITVNKGHLLAINHGLRPAYHCAVDAMFLDPAYDPLLRDWAAFQKSTGAEFLFSADIAERVKKLVPEVALYEVRQFLKSTYFDRIDRPVPINLQFVQPGYLSVIHFAIVAAQHMGYKEICLLGCDMDFFLNPDAAMLHSYDSVDSSTVTASASELFGWDQVDLMAWCTDEFRAFRALRRLAESRGIHIINAGRRGVLDVFQREPLESIIARAPTGFS